ncbi:MAG: hypothetical protein K6G18_02075 [Treponema sp.]|nr:hypothetical protein [Treponema sp.]
MTYNVENIPLCFNSKSSSTKISILDYKKLYDEAASLSLEKVFSENRGQTFLDGWELRFTLKNGMTILKVEVQCPDENKNASETRKLLVLCEKVFALVENENSKIQTDF